MRFVWLAIRGVSELVLFLAMLYFVLVLFDVYMVISGQVSPGGPMLFHEALSLRDSSVALAILGLVGAVAYGLRRVASQKTLTS